MPDNRPTKDRNKPLTQKQKADIIRHIEQGNTLTAWCKDNHIDHSRVYAELERDPQYAQLYLRAREIQADTYADKIQDLCGLAVDGKVDANTARVVIDGLKWTASKLKPRTWGETKRVDVEVSTKVSLVDYVRSQVVGAEAIDADFEAVEGDNEAQQLPGDAD